MRVASESTSAVLGIASLVLVALTWRGRRWALAPLVVLGALSALSAVPALVIGGGVPAPALVLAAAIVTLTIVGIVFVARPARAASVAS